MVTLISASPLDWPIVDGPCGAAGPEGVTVGQWAAAKLAAVEWLWALSGRQFGTTTVVYRPEWAAPARKCLPPGSLQPWASQPPLTRAPLPGPVESITEVKVDGAVVAPSAYLIERDLLVRTDGAGWPAWQDTGQPVTAAGTWQVTYLRGRPVPAGGQTAAGVLACELAAALVDGGECRLPSNVQTVTRNGVTINVNSLQQLNLTGLTEVDTWVQQVNPGRLRSNPTVWSPDVDPDGPARRPWLAGRYY